MSSVMNLATTLSAPSFTPDFYQLLGTELRDIIPFKSSCRLVSLFLATKFLQNLVAVGIKRGGKGFVPEISSPDQSGSNFQTKPFTVLTIIIPVLR